MANFLLLLGKDIQIKPAAHKSTGDYEKKLTGM
jgi:hypothetical protein